MADKAPAIWLPAVRCGTGTDVFTEILVHGLQQRGLRAEITWLPHRTEYAPWTVPVPRPPIWANVVHINTWLHPRFIPEHLPAVATLHHSIHDPALRPYKGWLRAAYHRFWIRHIEKTVMRRVDRVVAVSHFAAESARLQVLDRLIQVIYNGVDTERFQPPLEKRAHHPFQLLYVGSWMARKGVDLLAPIMRALGNDFVLHYTGGAAAEKDKPDMPTNMHDLGRLSGDALITAMQEADALLFPSRSEGFGLVAAEAMACGQAVIATYGSSLIEVIEDGVTGLLCPQDDVQAFASAVRALATNPVRHAKISAAARQRSTQHFTTGNMINNYIHEYNHLLNHHNS